MQAIEVISKVIGICNKKPLDRSHADISTLVDLTKTCKVFKTLAEENGRTYHIKCCKHLNYWFGAEDDFVFKYGEEGTRFYIIISGLVSVEVPKKNLLGDTVFIEAVKLGNGCSFGELALESSKPRAASIRCKQDSHFLYLEKQDYVELLAKIVQDKRDSLVEFLRGLPIFSTCTRGTLTKLTYGFKEKSFNKGQVVYKEGENSFEVFLVKKGEFEFFKVFKETGKVETFGAKEKAKTYKIADYGVGEMFGEEDAFQNKPRGRTCKALYNNSVLLVIEKHELLRLIAPYPAITDSINRRTKEKLEDFQNREKKIKLIERDSEQRKKNILLENHLKIKEKILEIEQRSSLSKHRVSLSSILTEDYSKIKEKSNTLSSKSFRKFSIPKALTSKILEQEKFPGVFKAKKNSQFLKKFLPDSLNWTVFQEQGHLGIVSMAKIESISNKKLDLFNPRY